MNLSYRNNWASDEYFIDGNMVKTLSHVEINGILFPVTSREVSVSYNDHGHTYSARSIHYFITATVGGVTFEKDLNTLVGRVKVNPLIFEVQQ